MKTHTRIKLTILGIAVVLLLSVVFLWVGNKNSNQSDEPMLEGVSFSGEYKIGDGEWAPILPGKHIPSTEGDVTLRGFFQAHHPITNEPLRPVASGTTVALYFNHIGGTVYLPSGQHRTFDPENEVLGKYSCAVLWSPFIIPEPSSEVSAESENGAELLTIVLRNPHSFGNENAVDDFLQNMSLIYSYVNFERSMLNKGAFERAIALVILVASFIILGFSAFSSFLHIKHNKEMWLVGAMSFFAGGYFLFDAFAVNLWNESYIFSTRTLGLCMMLYMLFASILVVVLLKGAPKKVAASATFISGATIICCITVSLFDLVKFFDTWKYWATVEIAVVMTLIICQIVSLKRATLVEKIIYTVGILTLCAFPIDVIATKRAWWEGGLVSKHIFIAVFIVLFVIVLRIIPHHITNAIKAKQLEAEQQALKLELQESRISVMLSQMQPHFIFNTLNTIYQLCEIDPNAARSTISYFSEYLRNNIDNLGRSELIPFEKELSFIKTYLNIEKVRFDDELDISFDIKATNFKLPVLTVQPIVENAVKHGTSKKEGGAKLLLSTKETDSCYEITIIDTGVGFDPNTYNNDGHKHIGISSVRQRLENLCDGTITIESAIGVGTKATINIPKKEIHKL